MNAYLTRIAIRITGNKNMVVRQIGLGYRLFEAAPNTIGTEIAHLGYGRSNAEAVLRARVAA